MTTPSARRDTVQVLVRRGISARKACLYLGLSRRVFSYKPRQAAKDRALAERLLAARHRCRGSAIGAWRPGWLWARLACAGSGVRWASTFLVGVRVADARVAISGCRVQYGPTPSGATTLSTTKWSTAAA